MRLPQSNAKPETPARRLTVVAGWRGLACPGRQQARQAAWPEASVPDYARRPQAMRVASTSRVRSSCARVTCSSGWWASSGSPGPKLAAGTPCSQKEATSVQPTLARGSVSVAATSAASSGWPNEGGAPSAASTHHEACHRPRRRRSPRAAGAGKPPPSASVTIGGVAEVQRHAGRVGHDVAGHSPVDRHRLELLGEGAAVEHDRAASPSRPRVGAALRAGGWRCGR